MNPVPRIRLLWSQRTSRERAGLILAAIAVLVSLIWTQLWAPSWRTLADAPRQRAQALAELQTLQTSQKWARDLARRPDRSASESLAAASEISQSLGATAQANGASVRIQIEAWSADTLTQLWRRLQETQGIRISSTELAQGAQGWAGQITVTAGARP